MRSDIFNLRSEPSLFEHTRLTPPYDASRDFRRAEKNRMAPVFVPRRDERRGGRGIRRRRKGTFVMIHSFRAANDCDAQTRALKAD